MTYHGRRYGLICVIMSAAVSGFYDLSLTQRECMFASGATQGKGCQHARFCSVLLSASSSEGQTPVKAHSAERDPRLFLDVFVSE